MPDDGMVVRLGHLWRCVGYAGDEGPVRRCAANSAMARSAGACWRKCRLNMSSFQRRPPGTFRRRADRSRSTAGFLAECREGYEATCHSMAGLIAAVARRCSGSGSEWFYFGATVQDLTDTWLMLTLREARGQLCRRPRARDGGDG